MRLFAAILFCLFAVTCLGQSGSKHMICRNVDDLIDDITTTGVVRTNVGPPGKRGLPGIKGSKGHPGEVDDERLRQIVRAQVNKETRDLEAKVGEMKAKIQTLTQTVSAMCDGAIYDGRCYWAEVRYAKATNMIEAQEICRKRGSRLADIYSKDHYDIVMTYLRSKLYGRPFAYLWTGMKKIYGNRAAYLSNNIQAPYTKARTYSSRWDTAVREYIQVLLIVRNPATASDQGMGATIKSDNLNGALCQSL